MRLGPAPGMATRLAFSVPGSAGTAGCEPSMDTVSWELVREMTSGDFLFLCRAFWMEAASDGRLANWWNTLRLRMIAYTRLQFPGGRGAGVHVCACVGTSAATCDRKSSGSDFYARSVFLPSNWYWIMLLKASSRKKTR